MSKGVYLIGESDMSDEDRIIKHYIKDDWGMLTGRYLLYTLGLLSEKPLDINIKTNLSIGKKICNIQVIESHSSFHKIIGAKDIIMALEILSMNNEVDESKMFEASNMIEELLKKLDDELFSILSVGEKIALEVLEKRNDGYNYLCDILIKDVYEKW